MNSLHDFPVRAMEVVGELSAHPITAAVNLCFLFQLQWGKKVFSQPPIVQVLPLKKMREACNFHHRYTSTMRDKIRKKNPENHIVGF